MSSGTIIWMIIFGIAALIFFVIAAMVSVMGMSEIKELINDPELQNND